MSDDSFLVTGHSGGTFMPSLMLSGGPGDDGFHLIDSFFDVFTEITVDGGIQLPNGMGDCLALVSDGTSMARYMPAGGIADAGIIVVDGMPIHFTGLEPVDIFSFAAFALDLPAGATGNDTITIDAEIGDFGDTSIVSGTSNGSAFEQAELTDVGAFTLNTATNDSAVVGTSLDVVNFNGSIIGADTFAMPVGKANLTLNVNAGSIPIGWDPGSMGAPVTVNVANAAAVHFGATQHLSLLNIAAGGLAVMDSHGNRVLVTKALTIPAGSGQLDLTNNAAIIDYPTPPPPSSAPTIRARLISGRNGGAWNGPGIMSSAVPSLAGTALGYGEASHLFTTFPATFHGQSVDSSAVLIDYTFEGDATLDRKVDVADLGRLATNWQVSPAVWSMGDFDYSDTVDVADLGKLATNWQRQLPAPSSPATTGSFPVRRAARVIDLIGPQTERTL
jgi:hypothetical protein